MVTVRYVERMLTLTPDSPAFWIIYGSIGLLVTFINLLLIYLVIRLAITHGMLSYSRQLEESRHLPIHRD